MEMPSLENQYAIFCGTFEIDPGKRESCAASYPSWTSRISSAELTAFSSYVKTNFYGGFVRAAFPELSGIDAGCQDECLEHRTFLFPESERKWSLQVKGRTIPFTIGYADLYFYPGGIGIFAIRTSIDGSAAFTDLADFLFGMRSPQSTVLCGNRSVQVRELVTEYILAPAAPALSADPFGEGAANSKLKSFCVAESDFDVRGDEGMSFERDLLFELGTTAPIGTIRRDDDYAPAPEYFSRIMDEQRMAFFRNWSALALFDTFTVLINKKQEGAYTTFRNFETSYFPIYMNSLFLKYALYAANNVLAVSPPASKRSRKTRDWYVDVSNRYYMEHISYNFLPNEIDSRIRKALDIDSETAQMAEKISRVAELVNEKQEAQSNFILAFLSVVTLSSALWDCSEWFQKLFGVDEGAYRFLSFGIVVFVMCTALFLKFLRRKG